MIWLYLVLAGVVGGVLAGMGMGGGTLTIPLLVLALGVEQRSAQFVNLAAFVPTGAAALAVRVKNGLVDGSKLLFVLQAALAATAASAWMAAGTAGDVLGKVFGGFLVLLALFGFFSGALAKRFGGNAG